MEFLLLGPLEVWEDRRCISIRGAKQRALLALLLLSANEVVSRDRLIGELWGERSPGTAEHSLDHQVSRLRKLLGATDVLVTKAGGYVLNVEPEQIDASRFEHLLAEGRRANAAGNPAAGAGPSAPRSGSGGERRWPISRTRTSRGTRSSASKSSA